MLLVMKQLACADSYEMEYLIFYLSLNAILKCLYFLPEIYLESSSTELEKENPSFNW